MLTTYLSLGEIRLSKVQAPTLASHSGNESVSLLNPLL